MASEKHFKSFHERIFCSVNGSLLHSQVTHLGDVSYIQRCFDAIYVVLFPHLVTVRQTVELQHYGSLIWSNLMICLGMLTTRLFRVLLT